MFIDTFPDEKEKEPLSALPQLIKVLDPSFKLFKSFQRIFHYSDELKFFHFGGLIENPKNISDGKSHKSTSGGYSLDSEEMALLKFIGESIERYCLDVYKNKDLIFSSYKDVKNHAIDIHSIVAVSDKQKQNPYFKRFIISDTDVLGWVRGISLKTGKSTLIPAQLVYLSYTFPKNEKIIYMPISTGAAGGTSLLAALRRGICEIIERDAFLIGYLNKLSPPKIDLKSLKNRDINHWLQLFERYKLELSVLDITTELGIPTFLSVVLDHTGIGSAVSAGLKTHLNPLEAILDSIKESQHPRCWVRRMAEEDSGKIKKIRPFDIKTLEERALYWFPIKRINNISFLLKRKAENLKKYNFSSATSEKDQLRLVLQKLWDYDMDAYFVDITQSKFRALGYKVVKVIIPQLSPFYLNEDVRYFGGTRLYNVPVTLGLRNKPLSEESLNQVPHPFL